MEIIIVLLCIVAVFYFIPIFVADHRKTQNRAAVWIITLFLGWTFVGWVVAFAMAASGKSLKQEEVKEK